MMLENSDGKRLVFTDEQVVIAHKDNPSNLVFNLTKEHQESIIQYFSAKDFHSDMAKWLESEQKELVTKEDLLSMLETIRATSQQLLKQRDAVVVAINRLDGIYQRYTNKENYNG